MFRTIRKIHLYAAFLILAFLLMFFITGAVLIMENTFPRKNTTEIKKISLRGMNYENIINEICSKYNIKGKMTLREWNYHFERPGYKAKIKLSGDSAQITIQRGSFGRTMSDLHKLRGYSGHWTHIAWAIMYDLSCLALLVFAFSGIYLWWKLVRNKTAGLLLLLFSTSLTVFTIVYLLLVC